MGKYHILPLVLSLAAFLFITAAVAAPATFDIATFTPPEGWQRVATPGSIAYRVTRGNETGQIVLYPSRSTMATPRDNFDRDWRRLVMGPLAVKEAPKLTTEEPPDGWTAITGAARVTRNGVNTVALLFTATGHGKVMSVVVTMTGATFADDVSSFFKALVLTAPESKSAPAP